MISRRVSSRRIPVLGGILVFCSFSHVLASPGPLEVFERENYRGAKSSMDAHLIYRGNEIPDGMNKRISSLILKKGYQLTIGVEENGMGLSKVLIAAKRDIRIPRLSSEFNDSIQFIRVVQWKNTIKKGRCGKDFAEMNEGWYYNWMPSGSTDAEIQFVPMATKYTCNQASMDKISTLTGVQDILGFNEPNHHPKEALVDQARSAEGMRWLMQTGLRISSPNLTEEGPRRWMPEFWEIAKTDQIRIDFVGVHWYDWGGMWPEATPHAKASEIFKRFRNYLTKVHDLYGLPIWITEFNANPARDNATQIAFLELALPYLDSLPYVERYAYFQPNGGHGDFREERGNINTALTPIGKLWRDHVSVPAMDQDVYLGANNLCDDEKEK